MCLHELHRLHKHTARPATWVVNLTIVGLNHLGNEVHHRLRRIVFALALAFCDGELAKEILIHTPDEIVLRIFYRVEFVNLVEQRGEFRFVQSQVRVVIVGKCPGQLLVLLLDIRKCVIDNLEDIRLKV